MSADIPDLEPHPAAELFPMLEGKDYEELVADIAERGLESPIVLYQGKILDGRNRHRACRDAGVTPEYVSYPGSDPYGYVVSLNLTRRHLSASQRAMIAEKLATAKQGERRDLLQNCRRSESATLAEAAAALNVSERSAASARTVRDEGAPELVQAVERDKIPVSTAAQATKLPKPKQRKIVKDVEAGKKPAEALKKQQAKQVKQEVLCDEVGIPVPEDRIEAWLTCETKAKESRLHLLRLNQSINDLCSLPGGYYLGPAVGLKVIGGKPIYRSNHLNAIASELRFNLPYACVCPYCHHSIDGDNSRCCKGLGWVTERVWKNAPGDYRDEVLRAYGVVGGGPVARQADDEPEEEELLDELGAVVPGDLAGHWRMMLNQHKAAKRLLADAGKLLSAMGSLRCGEVWATSLTNEVSGDLDEDATEADVKVRRRCADIRAIEFKLREAMPWASVCPYCVPAGRGRSHADCTVCHGVGYVTKQVWAGSPPDYRRMACESVGGTDPIGVFGKKRKK